MGLANIFSKQANFKGLFTEPEFQSISEVKHKAFLDVNEAGSEAAAATCKYDFIIIKILDINGFISFIVTTLTTLSAPFDEPIFRADHPFVFAIRSKSAVYFAGHVVSI